MNNTKLFTVSFLATLLVISSLPLYLYLNNPEVPNQSILNKFSSYEELKTFLETSSSLPNNFWFRSGVVLEGGVVSVQTTSPEPTIGVPMEPSESRGTYEVKSSDYSETNIQVEGVDEADIIKTDGEYIYIVSGSNITIVKAYPPEEAKVLSRISLDGGITGIFINGDKLAVFENEYGIYPIYEIGVATDSVSSSEVVNEVTTGDEPRVPEPANASITPDEPTILPPPIIYEPPTTSIKVYDISNKENPVLTRDFAVDGNYFSSRMIGDYVYVVATQYSFFMETEVFLPRVHSGNETEMIPANDIYYYNFSDTSYSFTTIIALNIQNDAQETTHKTILLGGTSTTYVSQNNI